MSKVKTDKTICNIKLNQVSKIQYGQCSNFLKYVPVFQI